ncbi:MAG: PIN domain-containing protein [Acidobacteria bacterium]|nr:PIN domain-containing protein [Acidobacteriota bacterium]
MGSHPRRDSGRAIAYLDTHAAVWLRRGPDWLSERAAEVVETHDLLVSPMVLFELQYLHELGRVRDAPEELLAFLRTSMGVSVCDLPWETVVQAAAQEQWTRDPFDRLIVANAKTRGGLLLTSDRHILSHFTGAFC